ncbi:MAG: hypothetical protein ACK5PS_11450 [Desulfopila sp.]
MTTPRRPTELPGEKIRKAVDEFSALQRRHPEKSVQELLETVSRRLDLSPLECAFLQRQLGDSP